MTAPAVPAGRPAPAPITDPGAPRPRAGVRLVALDLDGTVLDHDQQLHPRTRDAVHAAVAAGVVVVAATGRMYRSALPWARELRLLAPLICYQGAVVRAMPAPDAPEEDGVPQGRLIAEDPLDADSGLRALQVARAGNWHIQAYRDDRLFCEQQRPEADLYARIAQVPYELVDDLEPVMRAGSTKVVCVVEPEEAAARCEAALREALGPTARVVRSLPPFVEVTNPLAGKGRALTRICELLDIAPEEVVAVGDAPNDIDMMSMAGFAVGVEGARDPVLAAADAVCAPPEQAGVADVLEVLGLTG